MKTIGGSHRYVTMVILSAALVLGFLSYPTAVGAQNTGASALVGALQGESEVFWEGQQEEKKLQPGETVRAWNTITTDQNSRLVLRWSNGLVTSQGDLSSIFMAKLQTPEGERDTVQVIEGIVRVATLQSPSSVAPYSVVTPVASIEPASFNEHVDFIVEVYDPSTTVITVVAGDLKVTHLKSGAPMATILSRCQTVYVEEDKDRLEVIESSPEDVARLFRDATIPGAMIIASDSCIKETAIEPPPGRVEPAPSLTYVYPATPDYYVEAWDEYDYYPYEEIVVMPPRPGVGCVIVVPGTGEFVIPLAVFGDWAYDPAVVQIWAQNFFFERIVYHDWHHLRDWRWRKRQLYNTMYLAQLAGNRALLRQARHELDFVNVRTNWLEARLGRLEGKVAGLKEQQRGLASRLPRGFNLNNAIADSFTSPTNIAAVSKFQNKLKTDREVQGRLINVAGNELTQLRTQLAKERNPEKRWAMRNELDRFRNDVARDRLPISPKQTDVKNLVSQLSKEKDPNNQERIQKQLLGRLEKEPGRVPEVLDQANLNSLKQDLAKFPNPEKRRELEGQVTQLQKSLEARKETEAVARKAEELTAEAARERNPQKQQELIGKLKELSGPMAVVGGAAAGIGAMQLIQQRQQHLEKQVAGEKDKAKQATLQQSLDELKKRHTELQQQEIQRQKRPDIQPPPQLDRQRQLDIKKQEQLERQKPQDEQKALRLRQQQEERMRQLQLRRQEQEERQKQLQRRGLEQQEPKKTPQSQLELDRQKRQQELQQRGLQQQESEKQLQQRRLDQEQQKKQIDELKRQELLKQQQERSSQEQLRIQQEQMRQQQEKSRQEQLRLQSERTRQEQLKQQQEQSRQQQLRIQQDQMRQQQLQQQQQQQRQQQMQQQQQQLKQQQLQQQQMRQQQLQQQEQARQQQLRIQQQREEEQKRRRP